MNISSRAVALTLLFVAAGCADSSAPQGIDSIPAIPSPQKTTVVPFATRTRSIVKLTSNAVAKFKEVLVAQPTKHIRLTVKNQGPTGFQYDLQIDDTIHEFDFVDQSHGFTLVVDPTSSLFLEGATIDWLTEPDGRAGFKFDNPNAVAQ